MDRSNRIVIDAVPQQLPIIFSENECNKFKIENLLSEFCSEDYKSAFFLLMDFIGLEKFISLTKKDDSYLKKTFIDLYHRHLNEKLLIELLATLKMYKKLRVLGTCAHLYESNKKQFAGIDEIWKVLYSLCEELTDDELEILKDHVEPDYKDQILSAEDWFCWALQHKIFSQTNLYNLENIFRNYPKCLDIIKSYKDFEIYDIRTPTAEVNCGLALILNYDKFDKNSDLQTRYYSYKDVDSLKHLWETFGLQVELHENLTCLQTFEKIKYYASVNYSNFDVFVCCILSHGESNAIYSSDGELMEVRNLLAPVINCIGLNKKPKLFFIQACQGPNIHEGIGKPIYQLKTINTPVTKPYSSPPPVVSDTLITNSSIDGYVSFSDHKGSWFIQTLCKQMMEKGENSSIEEIMTRVNLEVSSKYSANLLPGPSNAFQIVNRASTLCKKLFLKKKVVNSNF